MQLERFCWMQPLILMSWTQMLGAPGQEVQRIPYDSLEHPSSGQDGHAEKMRKVDQPN